MDEKTLKQLFELTGKTAVVTGGGGVLCSTMSKALGHLGVAIAVLDVVLEAAERVAAAIREAGGEALAVRGNVLEKASLEAAAQVVMDKYGRVDYLVNGAGGNKLEATTSPELRFFDLPEEALRWVFDLNFMGTFLCSQVFGGIMVAQKEGVILNISSMNAFRPLTRIPAYSAGKAAVSNFTQWLAVHMAQEYSPAIRVNALAPGFFLTAQNRFLLTNREDGSLTGRGQQIIANTPQGRFGNPEDLVGTMVWLLSPASSFVTGVVVPVDGGFSAFSGV